MGAARHTSVSASANYQQRNATSESHRVVALLGPIIEEPASTVPPLSQSLGQYESPDDDYRDEMTVEHTSSRQLPSEMSVVVSENSPHPFTDMDSRVLPPI